MGISSAIRKTLTRLKEEPLIRAAAAAVLSLARTAGPNHDGGTGSRGDAHAKVRTLIINKLILRTMQ
jgi:hypothetical protein